MPAKSTTARIKATKAHADQHHLGFNAALDKALAKLSKDVGTGTYDVRVEFSAEVKVTNPGSIGFYQVTLTD